MGTSPLPAAHAAMVQSNGLPTPPYYQFLQALWQAATSSASSGDLSTVENDIKTIAEKLGSPDGDPNDIPPLPSSEFPILQVLFPLISNGLLQNGFAQLRWAGTTDNVPQGETNPYFCLARVWAT